MENETKYKLHQTIKPTTWAQTHKHSVMYNITNKTA